MAITPNPPNIAALAEQDDQDRLHRYQRAWNAYENGCELPYDNESPDNIRLDYARLIVDKGVSFLAGKGGVTLQVIPRAIPAGQPDEDNADGQLALDSTATDQALAALEEAWPHLGLDFHNLAVNGGVTGHAWLRLHEAAEGGPPRIAVLDSGNVTAAWNEDDLSIIDAYTIAWNTVDQDTGRGVARRKRIIPNRPGEDPAALPSSWTIYDEELRDASGTWLLLEETAWPYSFAPAIGAQNLPSPNTFYGAADLEPAVLDMIEQLQSLASDMRRIARLHGHPVPVVIGEEADRLGQIDVQIGALLAIPNKDAKLDQLAIAELTSLLELYRELKTAVFEAAHVPKVAIGETTNSGPTAGVALQVEYAPLIERTQTKRLTYGPMLTAAADGLLAMLGYTEFRTVLSWPDLLPRDEQAEAMADEAEIRMQIVSRQTIAEKRGYDWDIESQRISEEKRQGFEDQGAAFDRGQMAGSLYGGRDRPLPLDQSTAPADGANVGAA